MTLSAYVSSSLQYENGYYYQQGNAAIPVTINVFNSSSNAVTLRQIYLTQDPDSLLLGDPILFRRGVQYAPANNIVPAATVIETSGSVPIPSGSGDSSLWIAIPFQTSSEYTIGAPPLVLGPYIQNLGFYGINTAVEPPFLLPVYPSTNNSSIINVGPTPIFSGAVNLTQALNFTSSVFTYDPNVSQGSLFGQLNNFGYDPPTSSQANEFTYEWWSKLRSYGVPWTGGAQPTTHMGTIWKTFGFPFVEGAGAQIGYLVDGKLYIMTEQDFTAPVSPAFPPYVGISSSAAVPLDTWTHQAITRNAAGLITFWINGAAAGTGTRLTSSNPHYVNNFNLFGDNLSIPYLTEGGNSPYEGLIENTCDGYFVNVAFWNYCKYTAPFVPPLQALTAAYGSGGGNIPVTSSQTIQGSASYNALFIPQVNPLGYLTPDGFYEFPLGAVVMKGSDPSITVATSSYFRIATPPAELSLLSPYERWSLADNIRPPENAGFDFQLTAQGNVPSTGELFTAPQSILFFSSSDPSVADVIANSDGFDATTSSVGGYTQLTASGGSVIINGTGSTTFYVNVFSPPTLPDNYAAFVTLEVVDALPVGISITPAIQNVFSGSSYPYSAYLLKSNGSKQDITLDATWSAAGADVTFSPSGSYQMLGVTGSYGSAIINVVSGGLSATARATIINRNF